jgi:hypothetical protein
VSYEIELADNICEEKFKAMGKIKYQLIYPGCQLAQFVILFITNCKTAVRFAEETGIFLYIMSRPLVEPR